jgi:internalin A
MTVFSPDLQHGLEGRYRVSIAWQYETVEFLGLPYLKDERPLTLAEIYVPLSLTWDVSGTERHYVPDMLEQPPHLVVLGDPGSGKSTLIKLLAYSFGRIEPTPLARRLGAHLPIPIILRDYRVRSWQTPEDMLRDFITHLDTEIRSEVNVPWLLDALMAGRGALLLDGLDEVGGQAEREHLRDRVILPLLARMPQSLAVLTSRIIGYEETPFDARMPGFDVINTLAMGRRRCYVAPFNDTEIEQFIGKWYVARERDERERQRSLESLREAIKRSDRIRRLASNPSLLILMTLIHRVTAELPSGRVKLYDKIVEAYLETIQRYRGLTMYEASLEEMKRWLAFVGWEMQSQRAASKDGDSDILVSRAQLLAWLTQAMASDRPQATPEEAASFLDYIARRSGLLIPRGPEEFAFVHLTFQEYFAAWHLRAGLRRFEKLIGLCAERMAQACWHETLVLLFELLAEFPGAGDDLSEALLQRAATQETRQNADTLFAELLLDAQSGLSWSAQKRIAYDVLAATYADYNDAIIKRLQQLTPERFEALVGFWLDRQLYEGTPETIGKYFFLVAPAFPAYQVVWPEKLADWVRQRGVLAWSLEQVYDAVLTGGDHPDVCAWAVSRLPCTMWLSEFGMWEFSLADLRRPALLLRQNLSAQHRLLAQLGTSYAMSHIYFLHHVCLSADTPGALQELVQLLSKINRYVRVWTPVRAQAGERAWARAGKQAVRKQVIALAQVQTATLELERQLARVWVNEREQSEKLAWAIAQNILLISPLPTWFTNTHGLATDVAWAEQLFFTPDAPLDLVQPHREALERLTAASDDWSRLLSLTSLMLLGAGTPERCAARNTLLDKGMQQARAFTFPADVREATSTAEFQRDFPTLLQIIFLHKPGEPWLQPEWFDLSHPAAQFFRASPREFFARAAAVLDPEGKTDLAKWRVNGNRQAAQLPEY